MSSSIALKSFQAEFPGLSKGFKKVLSHLMGIRSSYNNVYPHQKSISDRANISIPTVKRAIAYFLNMGWMEVVRMRKRKNEIRNGNSYQISDEIFRLYKELTSGDGRRSKVSYQQKSSRENDPYSFKNKSKMIPTPPKNDPYYQRKSSRENDPSKKIMYLDNTRCAVDKKIPDTSKKGKLKVMDNLTNEDKKIIYPALVQAYKKQTEGRGKVNFTEEEIIDICDYSCWKHGIEVGVKKMDHAISTVVNYKRPVDHKIGFAKSLIK